MADRIALCIEPDATTADQLRRLLAPNGFEVKNIPSGDEAMEWGRTHKPAVIVLSVEPKKVGYAICNKLRRSPSLREVPLVLISSEETQAVLDQHKKLKAHADEYMLKPFQGKDLLVKIGGLLKLDLAAPAADDDDVHELDADSDIVMAEDDDIDIVSSASADENDGEEKTLAVDPDNYGIVAESANAGDTSEQQLLPEESIPNTPFEGEKFDPETQAAFAALEAGSPETAPPSGDMVDLRNLWTDDDLPPTWRGRSRRARSRAADLAADAVPQSTEDPDVYRTGETLGPEPLVADALLASALADARARPTCRRRPTRSPRSRTSRPTRAGGSSPRASERQPATRCARARPRRATASSRRGSIRSRTSARRCARRSKRRASGSPSRPPSPRSASSSGCARLSTRKRRTSSICAMRSTPRTGRSSTTRTRSASSIGRGAISRRARSGSSGTWWRPTRRSPSWGRTERSRASARRG